MSVLKKLFNFKKNGSSSKHVILLVLFVAVVSLSVSVTLSLVLSNFQNLTVPSVGVLRTIGVEAYSDFNCTQKVVDVDWGDIQFGTSGSSKIYLKSISNVETYFHLESSGWFPSEISEYADLSWDYNGQKIGPGQVIEVNLFLSLASSGSFADYLFDNAVSNFGLDIQIFTSEI